MNREIKFRAWCENEKGDKAMLSDMAFLQSNGIISTPVFHYSSNFYIIRKAIMMQFTGLKDKNGKEIYEGDIVSKRETSSKPYIGEVFFADVRCSFAVRHDHHTKWMRYDDLGKCRWSEHDGYCITDTSYDKDDRMEVIGNIYENGELLKNGQ